VLQELEALKVTHMEREKFKDWICNWSYLSISLQSEDVSEHDFLVLIKLEIEGGCRESIIHRLYTRLFKLRKDKQWKKLKAYYEAYQAKRKES